MLDPYLPLLNNWYVGSGDYKGQAELTTNDGKSYEGDATLVWDDTGNLEATVYLDNAPIMAGHQIMESNSAKMAITTSDGGYRANRMIASEASLSVGKNSERPEVRLVAIESEYERATGGKARYWVAPLINFISKFNLHLPDTDRHPLRLYPTPIIQPASSRDEAFIIGMKAHSKNRLINFRFHGDVGFIEPLPSYAERAKALEGHEADRLVTALMIGNVPSDEKTDIAGVTNWFPWDYLSALSVATGTSVGCAFIELRDKDGVLIKRLHIPRKPAKYSSGHHVLDESVTTFKSGVLGIESATGVLMGCVLTAFASKPYLRSIANWIVAAEEGGIIEDNADNLVRAFEGFTTAEGLLRKTCSMESFPVFNSW